MARQLFTVGYEGTKINPFISNLHTNNIDCIIDVRDIPLSRKPGFSKTALAQNLKNANIHYVHLRELGTPKTVREKLRLSGNYEIFFRTMDEHLASKKEAIEFAYKYMNKHTCCLMCFEHSADECHRSIVAKKIKERDGNGLQIKHL